MDKFLALDRMIREASFAENAEEALWVFTRALPSLLGNARPSGPQAKDLPDPSTAATAFMKTPDGKFHLITAPVNFAPEQHHEKVAIELGHPAHVAKTKQPLLLRNTRHHESFVKILQTFRAGSAMFAPMMWGDEYLGVLICASAIPETYSEIDLCNHRTFAAAAACVWMAKGGPEWLTTLDYDALPERTQGS